MKKRKTPTRYQDGENQLENGISANNTEFNHTEMGQYAIIELEIDQCLKDEETYLFRKTLQKVHSKFVAEEEISYKSKVKPLMSRPYIYAIAAAIAIIIGIFGVLQLSTETSKTGNSGIFAQYFKPYQNEYITRSDEVRVNNLYFALQAYENHDYAKAIVLFNKVIEADKSQHMAYFYKGVSCIEMGNYNGAIESLNVILNNENNPYYAQSKWYLALTYLKLNNPAIAKQHLDWLALNDRYYGTKAKEILKKLNK